MECNSIHDIYVKLYGFICCVSFVSFHFSCTYVLLSSFSYLLLLFYIGFLSSFSVWWICCSSEEAKSSVTLLAERFTSLHAKFIISQGHETLIHFLGLHSIPTIRCSDYRGTFKFPDRFEFELEEEQVHERPFSIQENVDFLTPTPYLCHLYVKADKALHKLQDTNIVPLFKLFVPPYPSLTNQSFLAT